MHTANGGGQKQKSEDRDPHDLQPEGRKIDVGELEAKLEWGMLQGLELVDPICPPPFRQRSTAYGLQHVKIATLMDDPKCPDWFLNMLQSEARKTMETASEVEHALQYDSEFDHSEGTVTKKWILQCFSHQGMEFHTRREGGYDKFQQQLICNAARFTNLEVRQVLTWLHDIRYCKPRENQGPRKLMPMFEVSPLVVVPKPSDEARKAEAEVKKAAKEEKSTILSAQPKSTKPPSQPAKARRKVVKRSNVR